MCVFSQRCSTLPFFREDCLLLKISFFIFLRQKTFPSRMKSPVEGETHYSASLHLCAFGLLECIVNNGRSKGTWMGGEEGPTGTENELGVHLMQVERFHSLQIPSGAGVLPEGFAALVTAGRMDLPGRAGLARSLGRSQPRAGVVWIIFMPVLRICRNLTGVLL